MEKQRRIERDRVCRVNFPGAKAVIAVTRYYGARKLHGNHFLLPICRELDMPTARYHLFLFRPCGPMMSKLTPLFLPSSSRGHVLGEPVSTYLR